jgi:hypothetical protein
MTTKLTAELRQALAAHPDEPVHLVDEESNTAYVLLRADLFERLKSLFVDEPFSEQERLFQLREFGKRAGWDDPAMDVYDNGEAADQL